MYFLVHPTVFETVLIAGLVSFPTKTESKRFERLWLLHRTRFQRGSFDQLRQLS